MIIDLDSQEKLLITDEELLFKALDGKLINTWEQFEFILAFIIENRLM